MIRIFAGTDKGRVRPINQDAFVYEVLDDNTAYAVLCDGMGGESGGHIASSKAVEIIGQALSRGLNAHPLASSVKPMLISAITAANAVIFEMSENDKNLRGMGTTVVAAVVRDDLLCIAHAGDSRAYLFAQDTGKLRRLTRDHSVVQLLVDNGEITEEEAKKHPKRNYITRALGVERMIELEYSETPFAAGRLLLCSDGLYNFAPPEEHLDLVGTCASEQDVFLLIDEANKAGGSDNITAVIIAK
ncbi:Stp1/IreP family PP2C-type Ser/Thr phosphatase [Anaerotruncus rubiinfantis]|uniref:Stp1/IreP family PP2C-type Ser/Thr phosphatase n=1 Tax=Anaerotruncus rubiinfantis TaxID=1720200 RepID=UPI0034A57018